MDADYQYNYKIIAEKGSLNVLQWSSGAKSRHKIYTILVQQNRIVGKFLAWYPHS